ncbi:hypothetical protein CONPUDRAFT_142401 [Coniophora puteana RWD-64-598 SS2]|uniref:DUF6697 domain-containing protein n=1 Tax=Coniophora puteana (strain RWD-64-598) TaxID=741705 RepID=A0A5M3MXI6_CONPW|nr:uncharacterized protein CONPUDRAFT_142401 [Coniophora puteana RWD-64-598 SS2]EIW83873.1 hypothetical protein CONPUDRAFT_142401 [Coniophora puteana RWD-64-598 SS2]
MGGKDFDHAVEAGDYHSGDTMKREDRGPCSEVKREEGSSSVKVEDTESDLDSEGTFKVENHEDTIKAEEPEKRIKFYEIEDKVKDTPEVVIKKETMATEEVVQSRLTHIHHHSHPVDLDTATLDTTATREFLSRTFGGDAFSTFPRIAPAWLAKHGMNDFAYPNLTHNPHAPWRPGAPGLFFALTRISERERTLRIIVGLRPKAWQYIGQYVLVLVPQLSKEEWLAQSEGFKQTWINYAFHHDRAKEVRVRIHYQKQEHREPLEDELAQAIGSRNKYQATREEIRRSYDVGEQRIYVWCMKCVDYDVNFQMQIAEKLRQGQPQRGQASPRRSKRKRT